MAVDLRRLRNRKALMERAAEAGMRKSRVRARLHGARRLHAMPRWTVRVIVARRGRARS